MTNQMRKALMTVGFAGLLSGALLPGQSNTSEVANVPFAFQAADRTMPPGEYSATLISKQGVVKVTNRADMTSVVVPAFMPMSGKSGQSKLGFHCYSGKCFLSEIWYATEDHGHGLGKSKSEKEIAANAGSAKQVYLAMR
jgi:hypothetical protein